MDHIDQRAGSDPATQGEALASDIPVKAGTREWIRRANYAAACHCSFSAA